MSKENIAKRTRFFVKKSDGSVDFVDFARVLTTKGSMVEPFTPEMRGMGTNVAFDCCDDMVRVDELVEVAAGREKTCLSSADQTDGAGQQAIHGGACWLKG